MTTEPKDIRLPIMVTASEAAAIDDFRFKKRINTRAEAIRLLIARGLAFDDIGEATETILEHSMNLYRGVDLNGSDRGKFLDALTILFETVDSADEEVEKSLDDAKKKLNEDS